MKERGQLAGIGASKEKYDEVNTKIKDLISKPEDLKTPVCAFITFNSQEARDRCVYYFCDKNDDGSAINHE
jgi:hypothetical protein